MNLFYVLGGGWGHLKRVSTFIKNEGITDFKVISANSIAFRLFESKQIIFLDPVLEKDMDGLVAELERLIIEENPLAIYVDVFPNGILGELCQVSNLEKYHLYLLCRHIKWEKYISKTKYALKYERAFVFEDLGKEHAQFVASNCMEWQKYSLKYPSSQLEQSPFQERKFWLIVHGSNPDEVETLCRYAIHKKEQENADSDLVLISDCEIKIPGIIKDEAYLPTDLYPWAQRIFSGGGFNTVHETAPFRKKQSIMPFPRKYDDQFWRKTTYC